MQGFTIPFDPIGYFTDNPFGSKIISLKDTMIYNFIKELTLTNEQILKYNTTKEFEYNTRQQNLYRNYMGYLINYLQSLSILKVSEDLKGYEFNFGKEIIQIFPFADEAAKMMEKQNIPIVIRSNIVNTLETCYKKFTEFFYNDYDVRDAILHQLFNIDNLKPKPDDPMGKDNVRIVHDYIDHGFLWLEQFSKCIEHWKQQYYYEINTQIQEASEMLEFMKLNINNNTLIDYTKVMPLADFKNEVLLRHTAPGFRKKYFLQNFHNIRIFTAKIGGRSLLQWYGSLMFDYKKDSDESQTILNFIADSWEEYYKKCGYVIDDVFEQYLKDMVATELKYLPARIQQEELMKENAKLKVQMEKVKEQADKVEAEKKEVETKLIETRAEIELLNKTNNTYEDQITRLTNQNEEYKKEIVRLQSDIENNKSLSNIIDEKLGQLNQQKQAFEQQQIDLQAKINQLTLSNSTLEEQILTLQQEKTLLENQINDANNTILTTNQMIDDLQKQNDELEMKIITLQGAKDALETQLNMANASVNNMKAQLKVFWDLIQVDYDDSKSMKDNVENIGAVIMGKVDELNEQINQNNEDIKKYEEIRQSLINDKKDLANKLNIVNAQLASKTQELEAKNKLLEQYSTISQTVKTKIEDVNTDYVSLQQERRELTEAYERYQKAIEELNKKIEENNSLKTELDKKIKENNEVRAKLIAAEQELIKREEELNLTAQQLAQERANIEAHRKEVLAQLNQKENVIKKQLEELNRKINMTLKEMGEFIPQGIDPTEGSLIMIIYKMAINPNMSIKGFRDLFISEILKQKIKVELPKEILDNSEVIYTKSIFRWFAMYQQRLRNLAGKDFNPEGIIFQAVRENESKQTAVYLEKLLKANDLYNYENFKRLIISYGISDEEQKAYFYARLNHDRIGEAVIGDKSIDEWFAAYLTHFFGGYKEKYEKDSFI